MTEIELLRDQWRAVASSLSIQFITPFFLPLPDGSKWEFAALLPQFGGERGILIGVEHSAAAFAQARACGYGVCSMLGEHHHLPVLAENYIECLSDWGWVGQGPVPEWYTGAA